MSGKRTSQSRNIWPTKWRSNSLGTPKAFASRQANTPDRTKERPRTPNARQIFRDVSRHGGQAVTSLDPPWDGFAVANMTKWQLPQWRRGRTFRVCARGDRSRGFLN